MLSGLENTPFIAPYFSSSRRAWPLSYFGPLPCRRKLLFLCFNYREGGGEDTSEPGDYEGCLIIFYLNDYRKNCSEQVGFRGCGGENRLVSKLSLRYFT